MQALGWRSKSFNRCFSSGVGESSSSTPSISGYRPPARNCVRLVILGSSKVGKSAIVSRFLSNRFDENYTPTIEDFHRKLYRIRGEVYQLDILDTSGNHPFPAMRRLSFLTDAYLTSIRHRLFHEPQVAAQSELSDLFVLVYSVDSLESFQEVCRLRDQIVETKMGAEVMKKKKSNAVPMVIVGNKCDKDERERLVSCEEVATYVSALPCCAFVETSAKRNLRIDDVFCELFILANLPAEMSPSLHKKVAPGFLGVCQNYASRGLSLRRRLSDACGMVAPDARRPSIRTDLLILQAKTSNQCSSAVHDNGRSHFFSCALQ